MNIVAGKYEILEKIGGGGMGEVYRAHQLDVERTVALKMLSPALAAASAFRERFRQEAIIIARLSHPYIVNVIGIEPWQETFCIVMEYLEGEPLSRAMEQCGRMASARAAGIISKAAEALQYAHTKGIIHRDIKPDNIMLMEGDLIKVMDFGIAQMSGSSLHTQTGMRLGTPKFMSPEQARGKRVDARSDIYSLGLVLFHLVTGRHAFDADSDVEVALLQEAPPPPPSQLAPDIPTDIERVILKAIQKNPEDRFSSAIDMAYALRKATVSEGAASRQKSFSPEPQTPRRAAEPTRIKKDERFDAAPVPTPSAASEPQKFSFSKKIAASLIVIGSAAALIVLINPLKLNLTKRIKPIAPIANATPTPAASPTQTPALGARYYFDQARALSNLPQSDAAEIRRLYEKAIEIEPGFYAALREYGMFLCERKDYFKAKAFLERALAICPNADEEKAIQSRLALIHQNTK